MEQETVTVLSEQFVLKMIAGRKLNPQESRQVAKAHELTTRYATYDEAKEAGAELIKRYATVGARFTIELQYGYVAEADVHVNEEAGE